jgi:hypothetical protein
MRLCTTLVMRGAAICLLGRQPLGCKAEPTTDRGRQAPGPRVGSALLKQRVDVNAHEAMGRRPALGGHAR